MIYRNKVNMVLNTISTFRFQLGNELITNNRVVHDLIINNPNNNTLPVLQVDLIAPEAIKEPIMQVDVDCQEEMEKVEETCSSTDSLGESEILCPILGLSTDDQSQDYKGEILHFLAWFDSLTGGELLSTVLPVPPNIVLGHKALKLLRSGGYVLFHDNNILLIRINGCDGTLGTLDVVSGI